MALLTEQHLCFGRSDKTAMACFPLLLPSLFILKSNATVLVDDQSRILLAIFPLSMLTISRRKAYNSWFFDIFIASPASPPNWPLFSPSPDPWYSWESLQNKGYKVEILLLKGPFMQHCHVNGKGSEVFFEDFPDHCRFSTGPFSLILKSTNFSMSWEMKYVSWMSILHLHSPSSALLIFFMTSPQVFSWEYKLAE